MRAKAGTPGHQMKLRYLTALLLGDTFLGAWFAMNDLGWMFMASVVAWFIILISIMVVADQNARRANQD